MFESAVFLEGPFTLPSMNGNEPPLHATCCCAILYDWKPKALYSRVQHITPQGTIMHTPPSHVRLFNMSRCVGSPPIVLVVSPLKLTFLSNFLLPF